MANDEFEFILTALEFVATYGQRFLTLYDFNSRTGSWTARKKALLCLVKKNNCNLHSLPLANNNVKAMKTDNVEVFKQSNNAETKHNGIMVDKFAVYLETAKDIAHLLPKFPPQRRLQEEIDLNFLHFRV